ncbi:MAG: hypothetical protein J2O49_05530 [Sciscionella sp.]|nr:hypothetical protein [Sciscionella sp.]
MNSEIRESLVAHHNTQLVDELLTAYEESKRNYYEGGHRLSAVEGGRFCEAAYRLLEERALGKFTPLDGILNTPKVAQQLAHVPANSQPPSVRLHISRALRVVYDIRNNRDAAHLADGIDPNIQDATLVISILNWVLAELVRICHSVSADVAQRMVDELSTRKAPVIQEFGDFPRILRTDLRASDYVLSLLYHVGTKGVSYEKLETWVRPPMRKNLRRTLSRLDEKALVHEATQGYIITMTGKAWVEDKRLLQFP